MKTVIIGGGIAGLSAGIFLRRNGHSVVVCERAMSMPLQGHAFLMHFAGKQVLDEIRNGSQVNLPGGKIDTFSLRRPGGREIKHLKLDHWKCIKRSDLTAFLYSLFPKESIIYGRSFSHFIYRDNTIVAAAFDNGDIEYGDIFIGADGSQSKVRQAIFGNVRYSPVTVKEVVGTVKLSDNIVGMPKTFAKFLHESKGLAFGLIPTGSGEYVWFMQFTPELGEIDLTPQGLETFCKAQLSEFPYVVKAVMEANDFSTSYIWNTTDFDLMSSFHKENVVLIGDAAHLALPFTSTGTTNALLDAKTLADCLYKYRNNTEPAFSNYYQVRAADVAKHIVAGRELNEIFRNPHLLNDDEIPVPLIAPKVRHDETKALQVLYFTDPVCSTCWIIQPLLRKLHLEYGKYLDIKYCMGGLLPSWEGYNKGIIKQPSDAARHWEDVCRQYEMPMDGDVWIEDPLSSSYPPSIAFKAAQMQDTDKAILFLRRIKEMLFLEKKNIIRWEYLEKAAFETGLDSARLKRDFEGHAQELFKADLALAAELGIKVFPTLIFFDGKDQVARLSGYHNYDKFENIITKLLPEAVKEPINADPYYLFDTFYSMTDKEFCIISEVSPEQARKQLMILMEEGVIEKQHSKNGTIWTRKLVDQ